MRVEGDADDVGSALGEEEMRFTIICIFFFFLCFCLAWRLCLSQGWDEFYWASLHGRPLQISQNANLFILYVLRDMTANEKALIGNGDFIGLMLVSMV